MVEAYPLAWPQGWPRAQNPQRSNFGQGKREGNYMSKVPLTHSRALQNLISELERLGAEKVILSTNLELRLDGLPRSAQRRLDDPGVACYFEWKGKDQCIPSDKWDRVEDNMQAIAKTIEALRGIERWGAKEMVDAAFTGFKALPAPMTTAERYFDNIEKPMLKTEYHRLCRDLHPDIRGSSDEFTEMKRQYEEKQRTFQ